MTNIQLTESRKRELDRYSEEDVHYFWNIFTQDEKDYIEQTDQANKDAHKKIKFSVDGLSDNPVYEAIDTHPHRWNGWLIPIVSFETAKQIANDLFDPNCDDDQPASDILDCITHAKENFEDAVEIGCGICWSEVVEYSK